MIMKKLFKLFEKDVQVEDFSASEIVMWGLVVPFVLTLMIGVAGWLIGWR